MSDVDWIRRPIAITVKRHKCLGCKRSFANRGYATKHAARCQKIEINHGCKTCALFQDAERPSSDGVYPGCSEACGASLDLSNGLRVHCSNWEAIF